MSFVQEYMKDTIQYRDLMREVALHDLLCHVPLISLYNLGRLPNKIYFNLYK